MEAPEIRPAIPDDAGVVAAYHQRCFEKTYADALAAGALRAPDLEGTRRQLRDWFQPESEFETHVVIVDGAPIAHFTVRGHQLVHLFIEPGHQGMGLGSHLLAQAEARIAVAGHRECELHARTDNVRALAFYQRAGWTMTDRLIHTDEHGISYDEHVLVKGDRAAPSSAADPKVSAR